ncbi:acyltransferase domain-containing protein [Paenibacillus sp. SC116]|uniref:acyltransferase domain-containing protein n=1 Tax=Paenibacillus sp. SC116 TaxID=2968986 RepID=UPI00215A8F6B|nr:acyltransferase domain-containing protein [Paenibacillus sp. SC116]MCR8843801.1 acyltransferase domain-containing protein [Paenibacillus sp. SC116]
MRTVNAALEHTKLAVAGLGGCLETTHDLLDWWQGSPSRMEHHERQKERFDASLFRMSMDEASRMSSVELEFMEAAWVALQQAGCMRVTSGRLWIYSDNRLIQQRAADQLMAALSLTVPVTLIHVDSKQTLVLEASSRLRGNTNDAVLIAVTDGRGVGAFVIQSWQSVKRRQTFIETVIYTNGADVRMEPDESNLETAKMDLHTTARRGELFMLSAHTSSALEVATDRLSDYLRQHAAANLGDIAFSLYQGSASLSERRVLVPSSTQEAIDILVNRDSLRYWDSPYAVCDRKLIFMFSGLGDHYENMSREIYEQEPVFRSAIDSCCDILQPLLGFDLRTKLYPVQQSSLSGGEGDTMSAVPNLDIRRMLRRDSGGNAGQPYASTSWVHPALFTVEYALTRLLESWGIKPHGMIGHSLGEYTAACLAEVFTLEQALTIVAKRAQLIGTLDKGAMLAVTMTESEVQELLPESVTIALVNSPESLVLSGTLEGISELEQRISSLGKVSARLPAEYAFHSLMMEPAAVSLSALISEYEPKPPTIPFVSNVTGTWITAEQASDPDYWASHLCSTVRFSDGIDKLLQDQDALFIEIGPGQSLCSFVRQHPAITESERLLTLPTLRYSYDRTSDRLFLLRTIGQLWLNGVDLCEETFYEKDHWQLQLPAYPFERMPVLQRSEPIQGG